MRYATVLFFVLLLNVPCQRISAQSNAGVGIVPSPQQVIGLTDSLIWQGIVKIGNTDNVPMSTVQYLRNRLMDRFGIITGKSADTKTEDITFGVTSEEKSTNPEYYELAIRDGKVTLSARSQTGYFNAVNSLLQIIAFHGSRDGRVKLPNVHILDEPAFGWRGFMLDESRHFFGKEKVKQLLDWMAFYKLNKFHWHLTDEPAWRIEIKKYPMLGLVGGIGEFTNPATPSRFYTQDEIREIVSYAAERHIDIIPEIDMPGHATAANRAYPQFSGGGNPRHPDFTFHPGKEGTYQYLTNILKEINVLFPSGMIHLGGDEVSYGDDMWDTDSLILALKKRHELNSNTEVEAYFMHRMADSLYRLGAQLAVWDELADSGLPTDKTIQFWWRHDKTSQLELALKNNYPVVICPRIPFYFDFVQHESHRVGRKWNKAHSTIEQVYNYDFSSLLAKQNYEGQILGAQANLWTETVVNEQRFDFMIFPRIAALAETVWTHKENKNYERFQEILKSHLSLYKKDDIYFYDPFKDTNPEPKVRVSTRQYLDNPE